MRRIISLVLCLLMLVSVFAACSKTEVPSDTKTESKAPVAEDAVDETAEEPKGTPVGNGTLVLTDEPVEITMWLPINDATSEEDKANIPFDEIADALMEKYPQITVNLEGIGADSSQRQATLATAAAANNIPDLIRTTDGYIYTWAPGGVILEYSQYLSDDYFAAFKDGVVENGNVFAPEAEQVWSTPDGIECEGWVINTKILSDNGLEVPKTFDELLNVIQVLDGNGVLPIAHGGQDTWAIWGYHSIFMQYGLGFEQAGQLERGELKVEDSAFYNAFSRIAEIANAGAYADDVGVTLNDAAGATWLSGGAAIWQIYDSWRYDKMREYDSDPEAYADYYDALMNGVYSYGFEFEDDTVADDENYGVKMNNWGIMIGANAANDPQKLAACIAYIELMVAEESYEYWVDVSWNIQLDYSSENKYDYSGFGLQQSYQEAYALEGTFYHEPPNYFNIAITDQYRNCVTGLICGSLTVEEACNEISLWQVTAAAQLEAE